jgi:hypothetical protein
MYAETVDVAPGIDIERGHLRLLRTHIEWGSYHLLESREERHRTQAPSVAFATPKSITFGTGMPSLIVTSTLEGFRSPMDDALLMRMLHRVADLDEQLDAVRSGKRQIHHNTRVSFTRADQLHDEIGATGRVAPASNTLAMFG